jgi:NADP-dependent 3-hydroxy acid dehydrogenase YdfG
MNDSASSGLGNHFARTLASRGATVVASARRAEKLAHVVSSL